MNNNFRYRILPVPDPTYPHIYHSIIYDTQDDTLYFPLHIPLVTDTEDYNPEIHIQYWTPVNFVFQGKTYYHAIYKYGKDFIKWGGKIYKFPISNSTQTMEDIFKLGEKKIEYVGNTQDPISLVIKDEENVYEVITDPDKFTYNYLYKYNGLQAVPQILKEDKVEVYPTLFLHNLSVTDNFKVPGWSNKKPIVIVKRERYDDSGIKEKINSSNNAIIMPVFFRSRDLGNTEIHNEVTENICINLDAYKNKVQYFIIRIGNYSSQEIGRNNSGVIFQIIGPKIGNKEKGLYYILNEKGEVVTTGNYFTKN